MRVVCHGGICNARDMVFKEWFSSTTCRKSRGQFLINGAFSSTGNQSIPHGENGTYQDLAYFCEPNIFGPRIEKAECAVQCVWISASTSQTQLKERAIVQDRFVNLIPAIVLIVLAGSMSYYLLMKDEPRLYREFRASWRNGVDDLIVSRVALRFFLSGVVCVVAITVFHFLPIPERSEMSFQYKFFLGMFGIVAAITVNFLYWGMWRYWYKFDESDKWIKRAAFALMLLGFFWGSAVYYFTFYIPQVQRKQKSKQVT